MEYLSIIIPNPEELASSINPDDMPPSVGSCIAVTVPADRAILASCTTLIPGLVISLVPCAISASEIPDSINSFFASVANIQQPSIGIPLVSNMVSPSFALEDRTSWPFFTSPSIVPLMTG